MIMNLRQRFAASNRNFSSTPDSVAVALREAISSGLFSDGQPLRQDEIANELGISKIPVREALRQLEAEGLVDLLPNRGAVVAALSASEAREIMEIRVALETLAVRLSVPESTGRTLRQAKDILTDLDQENDVARWSKLNREFHTTLYTPANRPQLLKLIQIQHTHVDRYMRIMLATLSYQPRSQQEHRDLVKAYERRDIGEAVTILTRHIETAGTLLVTYLEQRESTEEQG